MHTHKQHVQTHFQTVNAVGKLTRYKRHIDNGDSSGRSVRGRTETPKNLSGSLRSHAHIKKERGWSGEDITNEYNVLSMS